MPLPANFTFNQNNLQDFSDCPRRFELRHLLHIAYPAAESEMLREKTRHMQMGQRFHQMIHQSILGVPQEQISVQVDEADLAGWWQSYLTHSPKILSANRRAEFVLAMPFEGSRLLAKLDLLAYEPGGRFLIVDWKTNRKKTRRSQIQSRWQTKVYPFLVMEAGKQLNGGEDVQAEQVEMIYWFTCAPEEPEIFSYTLSQYHADRQALAAVVEEIRHCAALGSFPLTEKEHSCAICEYRPFCSRDAVLPVSEENEDELVSSSSGLDLDFEQIGEIAF